jgi:epoxyqueuosine reductase
MKADRLWGEIQNNALDKGMDLVGVADLEPARPYLDKQGQELVTRFPRAISLGLGLTHGVVDNLVTRDPAVLASYHNLYTTVNQTLDRVALLVAKRLEGEGYKTFPVPASQSLLPDKLHGLVSHKLVAHLAGLGWIGKSCLLITRKFGPRVRFATILTTAPLPADSTLVEPECGRCRACVDICPAAAITGKPFNPEEDRKVRFQARACKEYTDTYQKELGYQFPSSSTVCGLCVYICPKGRRKEKLEAGKLANDGKL